MKYSQNEQRLVYNLEMLAILKQASWLGLAQILTRVISFFYTIFLARNFGVSDFGLYIVALSYFSIISAASDFGFNRFLIREIAQDRLKTNELLWNIAALRLTLTSALFAIFAVALYFFDPDKMRVSLILLATLAILPQSIGMTFDGIFIAMRKLQFSGLALFLSSLSNALVGYYLINKGFGPTGAVNALIIGQLIYAVSLFSMLLFKQGLHFPAIKLSVIKRALIGSLPYGLISLLGLLYFKIDSIMLSYLRGSFETGIYGVAYKFLEAIIFIPSAFAIALFPTLAKLHEGNISSMKKLYFKSLKLMAILGIVAFVGYFFLLPEVIKLFLPKYIMSIEAVRILSFSIPLIFIYVPLSQIVLASEKYLRSLTLITSATLLLNIILNLILIPKFGFLGAAFVTVFSDLISFLVIIWYIHKKILK